MAQAFINLWMVKRHRQAQMQRRKVTRRAIRDLNNPFELQESEFQNMYRISREMARDICVELGEELTPKKVFGVPVVIKVLTAVSVLAVGSYQRGIGHGYFLVLGQTTVSKFLRQFLEVFLRKFYKKWIKFPGTQESRQLVVQGFHDKYGLPDLLGCIGCTHIAITTPYINPESFLNHHGFYSLNVQLICDSDGNIININARYPGRTSDQHIFDRSVVKEEMQRLYTNSIGSYYLIGDSAYTLEPWMMSPISSPADQAERRYNEKICAVHEVIESVHGVLKATFRATKRERVLNYQPAMANKITTASCVLYNMMKHYRVPLPKPEADSHDGQPVLSPAVENSETTTIAREIRQRLVDMVNS